MLTQCSANDAASLPATFIRLNSSSRVTLTCNCWPTNFLNPGILKVEPIPTMVFKSPEEDA